MIRPKLADLCISHTATVREAMTQLNATASGTLFVTDDDGRLTGTLSDGDIRRWLLNGHDLNEPANLVANHNPVTLEPGTSIAAARELLDKFDIHLIPIIESDRRVIDFWTRSHAAVRDETPVVIMAGGLGIRLRPLTENLPKPMLQVGDVPLLERILLQHIHQGAHNFYFSVNYLSHVIEDHFGDGSRWGVKIRYLRENKRLGTGGALSLLAEEELVSDCVIVANGDVISEINIPSLVAHHRHTQAAATLCVRTFNYTVPFGVIRHAGGKITGIDEKPTMEYNINAGIYCVSNEAIRMIPKDEYYDMPTLVTQLVAAGKTCSLLNLTGFWIDIGSHEEYHRANAHYSM